MGRSGLTESERFDRIGWTVTDSGCWEWNGYVSPKNYGRFHSKSGALAHRFALQRHLGRDLHPGMSVMHLCDNTRCVRPGHLREGSHSDNMRDAALKERFPQARLNPSDVRDIRSRVKTETVSGLAREFGVVPAAIRAIRDRRNWAWVDEEEK